MNDLNNYNLQGFNQTQFQGDNAVLQQASGLNGPTDENGFFGATATTNDIFGQTIKTDTDGADFFGNTQTLQGTTTDTNTLFGATNTLETVTGTNTYGDAQTFTGATTDTNTFLGTTEGVTTTDPNNFFGTTQTLPGTIEANAFFSNPTMNQTQFLPGTTTQTTTTTTKTTYGTTDVQTGQINYDAIPTTTSQYLATGVNQITYDNYGVPMASVGYGTTADDLTTTTQTTIEATPPQTFNIPTITQTPTQTFNSPITTQTTTQATYDAYPMSVPSTAQTTYTTSLPQPVQQTQTVRTTQVQTIPQTIQVTPSPITVQSRVPIQQQIIQTTQPQIIQPQFGSRIIDEDFRRGRPVYNDTRTIGILKRPINSPVKLRYNVGNYPNMYLLNNGYGNTGIGLNRVGVNGLRYNNVGLDRLGRGGSYDVYGRGINPLLNRVGLGQYNARNIQTTSNIKDFL